MIYSKDKAKEIGQFFTLKEIADFMSALFSVDRVATKSVSVLDAGAGIGILGITLGNRLADLGLDVTVTFVENDAHTARLLREQTENLRFKTRVLEDSFVVEDYPKFGEYDFAIINPPYFKVNSKNEQLTRPTKHLWKGSPNIYASFMGICVELLKPGGQLVSITPRSFCNGAYFKGFREFLAQNTSLDYYHVFKSRKKAFAKQGVLQENVITKFSKRSQLEVIEASSSECGNFGDIEFFKVSDREMISPNGMLKMPESQADLKVLDTVTSWQKYLEDFQLKISTGPIVEFRMREHVVEGERGDLPLIRMHNLKKGRMIWDGSHRKDAGFCIINEKGRSNLVPKQPLLLLKRFTSKEEKRRLVTSYLSERGIGDDRYIAIENHVNFIAGELLKEENFARGLCALLNSKLMDQYFRMVSGNTQVNATDLRQTPLPDLESIKLIGQTVKDEDFDDLDKISHVVQLILDND